MTTTRFMMLMPWGRVGSNLLIDIVRQIAQGEAKLANENLIKVRTAGDQRNWFTNFYEIGDDAPTKSFIGSKQNLLSICDFDEMSEMLIGFGVRIVRLRRDNFVKCALSQIRAQEYAEMTFRQSGHRRWAVHKDSAPLGPTTVDCEVLMNRVRIMETTQNRLMSALSETDVLDLEYEEINAGLDDVVRRLRAFLRLPDNPYSVPYAKLTPDDLSGAIANYGEIRDRLADTPYASMI